MADGIREIYSYAFYHCDKLTTITLPKTIENFGNAAFNEAYCSSVKTVYFSGTLDDYSNMNHWYGGANTFFSNAVVYCSDGINCLHNWDLGKITVKNSCGSEGIKSYTCTKCGSTKEETIPATGNHKYQQIDVQKTKEKVGYTKYTCSVCNKSYFDKFTAPTGKLTLKCKARTVAAQTVIWNNVKTATGYQVQISTKDGKKWSTFATLKAGVTSYTFKNLAAGNNYKFRVRFYIKAADGKNYFSPWSATLNSPTLPSGTSITKLVAGSKAFAAQWKKNTAVNGYQVQYSLKSNFSGAKTLTIKSNKTLKTMVKKLSAKKVYYVRIRTFKTISKANYFSTWSKAYKVKTK